QTAHVHEPRVRLPHRARRAIRNLDRPVIVRAQLPETLEPLTELRRETNRPPVIGAGHISFSEHASLLLVTERGTERTTTSASPPRPEQGIEHEPRTRASPPSRRRSSSSSSSTPCRSR